MDSTTTTATAVTISLKVMDPNPEPVAEQDCKNVDSHQAPSPKGSGKAKGGWRWQSFIGIALSLLTGLSISLAYVIVKLLIYAGMHPITLDVWRQAVMTLIAYMVLGAAWVKDKVDGGDGVWRGVYVHEKGSGRSHVRWCEVVKIMGVGFLLYAAIQLRTLTLLYLTIADATVAAYISLVFALLLARFMLHEKCLLLQVLMGLLIILGALVITRPPLLTGATSFDVPLLIGVGFTVCNGFFTALYSAMFRKFREVHFAAMIVLTKSGSLVLALGFAVTAWPLEFNILPADWNQVGLLVLLAALTSLAHNALLVALKFEKMGVVTLLRSSDVPFAFIWQVTMFGVVPDAWSFVGTLLVCTGIVVTSLSKILAELPDESRTKQRCRWLLI